MFCTLLHNPFFGHPLSQIPWGLSPRLNWGTHFLAMAYDGAYSSNVSVRIAWISFGVLPCRKKKAW
jgi:hypothetical protein